MNGVVNSSDSKMRACLWADGDWCWGQSIYANHRNGRLHESQLQATHSLFPQVATSTLSLWLGLLFMFAHHRRILELNVGRILEESTNTFLKIICELPQQQPVRLQGACRPPDTSPTWLSDVVSEIKELWWNSIILRRSCGFLSGTTFLMQWYSYLFSSANIALLCTVMWHSVSLSVMTMYSGNILQTYLNTQTPKPVWQCRDLFSFRNSPTEHWCYFSSHPVKPACALYCIPHYFSVITLQQLLSRMSLVMWTCLQIGIVYVHLCTWQWVTPPGLLS